MASLADLDADLLILDDSHEGGIFLKGMGISQRDARWAELLLRRVFYRIVVAINLCLNLDPVRMLTFWRVDKSNQLFYFSNGHDLYDLLGVDDEKF